VSVHSSLRKRKGVTGVRSVFTRWERIQHLKANDLWSGEDDSVYGLPKVKTPRVKKTVKKKKVEAE